MSKVVDYIVYMTYDLHGQWDYGNAWSEYAFQSPLFFDHFPKYFADIWSFVATDAQQVIVYALT